MVTLPKITAPEQVSELVRALDPYPDVRIEIMIETPGSIFVLPQLLKAAQGKCVAAHFGAYDYIASLGIAAASQHLHHPACDFARSMMLATLAETRRVAGGRSDEPASFPARGPSGLEAALRQYPPFSLQRLLSGLGPASCPDSCSPGCGVQLLPGGSAEASERLRNFRDQSEQATRAGAIFDDAATGRGLLNYFERALRCGAISESEVPRQALFLTALIRRSERTGLARTSSTRVSLGTAFEIRAPARQHDNPHARQPLHETREPGPGHLQATAGADPESRSPVHSSRNWSLAAAASVAVRHLVSFALQQHFADLEAAGIIID